MVVDEQMMEEIGQDEFDGLEEAAQTVLKRPKLGN